MRQSYFLHQPPLAGISSDDWETPADLFDRLSREFGPFDIDAAAYPYSAKAERFFTVHQDGLAQDWNGRVWCNPPWKHIKRWTAKALEETQSGRCEVACLLLPAITKASWFHDHVLPHAEIQWIKGGVKFGGAKNACTWGVLVAVFRRAA